MKLLSLLIVLIFSQTWSIYIYEGDAIDGSRLDSIDIDLDSYKQIGNKFETESGSLIYRAQQQYKGVDIFGATLVISDNDGLAAVTGQYYEASIISDNINDDITPLITEHEALQKSITHYIPNGNITSLYGYKWDDISISNDLNIYRHNDDDEWTLSYVVEFNYLDIAEKTDDIYRPFTAINAKTGDIVYTFRPILAADKAWGTGGNEKIGMITHDPKPIKQAPDVYNDEIAVYDDNKGSPKLGQCKQTESVCEIDDYLINTAPNCLADAFKYAHSTFDLYKEWGPYKWNQDIDPYPVHKQYLPLKLSCLLFVCFYVFILYTI